jgi:ketosteroid isomerase-like protein
MSAEDVEVVSRALAAWNSGELARIVALTAEDFEGAVAPELSAEPDTYRGRAGIERYFDSFAEAFEEIRFEAEQITDAGASVVVAMRLTAVGKQTKIEVEQRNAGVWTVAGGKVARIATYASLDAALAAAGIEG